MTEDSTTPLHPVEIHFVRNIAGDPHQEDQHNADGEGEIQIVVRILRPLRPFGECFETDQRQQQRTTEGDVQSGDCENDETGRGHPVHEALECREADEGTTGPSTLEPHHAAAEIEYHEHGKHADDGDPADPAQRDVAELSPVAASGLFENAGALIGNADAPLNPIQFLQELLLLHRACRRVDLLRAGRRRRADDQHERQRA